MVNMMKKKYLAVITGGTREIGLYDKLNKSLNKYFKLYGGTV
jgi:hypothetical protein